jgi:hypothetical protein
MEFPAQQTSASKKNDLIMDYSAVWIVDIFAQLDASTWCAVAHRDDESAFLIFHLKDRESADVERRYTTRC